MAHFAVVPLLLVASDEALPGDDLPRLLSSSISLGALLCDGIGDAVAYEYAQGARLRQPQEGPVLRGHDAVEGNHAAELFGEGEPQTIRHAGPFREAGQVYPLAMHMVTEPGLFDRANEVVLDQADA